jgi:hypothetical protein
MKTSSLFDRQVTPKGLIVPKAKREGRQDREKARRSENELG